MNFFYRNFKKISFNILFSIFLLFIIYLLFNMPVKNYVFATFFGSMPSMFVTVALGSGIESVIDQNTELTFSSVIISPEIYLPISGLFIILIFAFIIKKIYFKN